jgi:hypothetical protein
VHTVHKPIVKKAISQLLVDIGESLFTTHTVDDLLFAGYNDTLDRLLHAAAARAPLAVRAEVLRFVDKLPKRVGFFYEVCARFMYH